MLVGSNPALKMNVTGYCKYFHYNSNVGMYINVHHTKNFQQELGEEPSSVNKRYDSKFQTTLKYYIFKKWFKLYQLHVL